MQECLKTIEKPNLIENVLPFFQTNSYNKMFTLFFEAHLFRPVAPSWLKNEGYFLMIYPPLSYRHMPGLHMAFPHLKNIAFPWYIRDIY